MSQSAYLRDPAAIYRESFAAIRREARIDDLPADLEPVAVRLIHACGMPDIVPDLAWTADAVNATANPVTRSLIAFTVSFPCKKKTGK